MKITPGKLAGMKAVSDERGVIAAAAMDQRGSLQKSLAKEKGGDDRRPARSRSSRSLVTEVLTPHASAILLDPEWGLPASKRRAKDAGLLMAYEKTGYDATTAGPAARSARRLVGPAPQGSGRRLHQDPALLHARRSEGHQRPQARLGRAHRRRVPRQRHPVLPRVHRLRGRRRREGRSSSRRRSRRSSPAAWPSSPRTATASTCMKVEMPINMKFVEGTKAFAGQKAYTKQEAMDHFRRTAEVATKPFIYLSAGVSNAEFTESLELAAEAGHALLGRAVRPRDVEGRHSGLRQAGRPRRSGRGSRARASRTSRTSTPASKPAHPWFEFYGAKSADELG